MSDPVPSTPLPHSSFSPRALAAIVVGVTLVAGILVGIGLDRAFFVRSFHGGPGARFAPAFGMMTHGPRLAARQAMRERFARDLQLTPEQQARIDTIMQRRLAAFDSIQEESRPRIRALIVDTRTQIDSILTPEQRERYHALAQRRGHVFRADSIPHRP
ncbi:MAG TPA: hypothetical protein VIC55_02625 [Gemmatimonadaceae bacterium]|jgi:Spy/CpxP family protein refolding chaperone